MNKNQIQKRIEKLRKLINRWNRLYYFQNRPEVSDQVYDSHYNELLELEKKYPKLSTEKSPTKNVGYIKQGILAKIFHKNPMLSLSNAFSKEDLSTFDKRIKKITEGKNNYFCEYKIDGLSVSLTFKNGKFLYASTRGNGIIGENITNNILQIKSIAKILKQNFEFKNFVLRGEVFIAKKQFLKLNEEIQDSQKTTLKELIINLHKNQKINIVFSKDEFIFDKNIYYEMETILEEELSSFKKRKTFIFNVFINENKILELENKFKENNIEIISILKNSIKIKINHTFSKLKFLNPRNAAAGSLRQLDSTVTKKRNLSVIFYDLIQDEIFIKTQKEIINKIKELGFPIDSNSKLCSSIEQVFRFVESSKKLEEFDTDGLVIKTNEKKYYKEIGETTKHPNYSIAYKFPEEIIETKLLDIFPTVGRTGKITYNAKLQQVFLEGTIVRAATLHNAEYIKSLDIRINDIVRIKKAGNIIPKVIGFNKIFRKSNYSRWKEFKNCPKCKTKLIITNNEIDQYCLNNKCIEKIIKSLIYFTSRDVMNIFGISEKIIRTFWDLGILKTPIDFYKLKEKKELLFSWIKTGKLINWGDKSINNLFIAIELSKSNSWDKLLLGLNIRYVGSKISKMLAYHFQTIDKLINAKYEEIESIIGIGSSVINSVIDFFSKEQNILIIEEYKKFNLNFKKLVQEKKEGFFLNKKVAITGTFLISRKKIVDKLEKQGAIFVKTISSSTNYLLVGNKPGSKFDKAKKIKITTLKEKEIFNTLKLK